jgi:hypothetical protein
MKEVLRRLAAIEARLNPPVVADTGQALAAMIERYDQIAARRRLQEGWREPSPEQQAKTIADFQLYMITVHGAVLAG